MNAKIYNGNVQPNPKEFKIWVNDEGLIKTWNGTEWVEQSGGSGSGSGESAKPRSSWKYFDLRNSTLPSAMKKQLYPMCFHIGRYINTDNNSIIPFTMVYINDGYFDFTSAAGVDTEGFTMGSDGSIITMEEFFNQTGLTGPNDILTTLKEYGIVEITEEEFLNLQ